MRPVRAARWTVENLPNPGIVTSSPLVSVLATLDSIESITLAASLGATPLSAAAISIRSLLFTGSFLQWSLGSSAPQRRHGGGQLVRGSDHKSAKSNGKGPLLG